MYDKTTWVDRNVQYPSRYTDELGNTKTFTPSPGTVTEAGTATTAARMNKVEAGIDQGCGYVLDLERAYAENVIAVDDVQTIWSNNGWIAGTDGTASLEGTTKLIGDYSAKCVTGAVNYGGFHLVKNIDLSTLPTTAYLVMPFYITTAELAKIPSGDAIYFKLQCDTVGTDTNRYYWYIAKSSIVADTWNYLTCQLSALGVVGSPTLSGIKGVAIQVHSDGNNVAFYVGYLQCVRKDPSSSAPNPLQSYQGTAWARDMQIVSGNWYLGYENNVLIFRELGLAGSSNSILIGQKSYTNCIEVISQDIVSGNTSMQLEWWVSNTNKVALFVSDTSFTLRKIVGGVTTDTTKTITAIAAGNGVKLKLVKSGAVFTGHYYLNGAYVSSISITVSDFEASSGYLAVKQDAATNVNIHALGITATDHAAYADTAENAKNIGVMTAADASEVGKIKIGTSTYTDNDTSQTFTDSFCDANTLVTIIITDASTPRGDWSVSSSSGSFTITSTVAESDDISFTYILQKVVT